VILLNQEKEVSTFSVESGSLELENLGFQVIKAGRVLWAKER
jgi:hypothetical protein